MPAGRPTEYRQEYCDQVIELGMQGKSVAQMASAFDVSKQTLLNWTQQFPEFLDAFTRAKTHAQAWWESIGQNSLLVPQGGGTFQGSVWIRSMAARFPDDWRENKGVELTGANGGPIQNAMTIEFVDASAVPCEAQAAVPGEQV